MERYKILVWILRALLSLEIAEYLEHQQEERKADLRVITLLDSDLLSDIVFQISNGDPITRIYGGRLLPLEESVASRGRAP